MPHDETQSPDAPQREAPAPPSREQYPDSTLLSDTVPHLAFHTLGATRIRPSMTVDGYLFGMPELRDALLAWAESRNYHTPNGTSGLLLFGATPTDLERFARDVGRGERSVLVIDGWITYGMHFRTWDWPMGDAHDGHPTICGLRIDFEPDAEPDRRRTDLFGRFSFGVHT